MGARHAPFYAYPRTRKLRSAGSGGDGFAGKGFNVDPMAGAGNGGHQAIQLGGGTLGFQVHCAVPVVFHPAGQIQQLGGILRTVAEANPPARCR